MSILGICTTHHYGYSVGLYCTTHQYGCLVMFNMDSQLACFPFFSWRDANRLCLCEECFRPSRLPVVAIRNGSCWVILLGGLAWWARNCCRMIFSNDVYFGVRGCGFTLASFVGLLGGAFLSWHALFYRICFLVHPCRPRIVIVSSDMMH